MTLRRAKKSSGPQRMANLRQGLFARSASLIVPALISLAALAGVTVRPALGISRAKELLRAAQERARVHDGELARWRAHDRAHSQLLSARGIERVRALVPEECSSVLAHGLMRTVAASAGFELGSLSVGEDVDLGLAETADRIVAREVTFSGRGSLLQILFALDQLRALGMPTCVFEAWFEREDVLDPRFEFRLVIGLLHYAPGSATEESPVEESS